MDYYLFPYNKKCELRTLSLPLGLVDFRLAAAEKIFFSPPIVNSNKKV